MQLLWIHLGHPLRKGPTESVHKSLGGVMANEPAADLLKVTERLCSLSWSWNVKTDGTHFP